MWGNTEVSDSDVGLRYFLKTDNDKKNGYRWRITRSAKDSSRSNLSNFAALSIGLWSENSFVLAYSSLIRVFSCLKCDECTVKGSHWFSAFEVWALLDYDWIHKGLGFSFSVTFWWRRKEKLHLLLVSGQVWLKMHGLKMHWRI